MYATMLLTAPIKNAGIGLRHLALLLAIRQNGFKPALLIAAIRYKPFQTMQNPDRIQPNITN
jgi:hypothetical protein